MQYSKGVFVTLPAVRFGSCGNRVVAVNASTGRPAGLNDFESRLLLDHARYGCISLLCRDLDQTYPFVFRPRAYKSIPCAQLVYCRDLDQFVRFAGALVLVVRHRERRARRELAMIEPDSVNAAAGFNADRFPPTIPRRIGAGHEGRRRERSSPIV